MVTTQTGWGSGGVQGRRAAVRRLAAVLALVFLVAAVVLLLAARTPTRHHAVTATACVYSGGTHSALSAADHIAGRSFGCVMLFDNAAVTWAQWDDPWFISNRSDQTNWRSFARAGNRLILTVDLFPSDTDGSDWRSAGAAGAYAGYATTLARNLVAAGMGDAVIRLGHEANGTWYPDNVGDTVQQEAQWAQFWRRTVTAMRSVAGAHFSFDWCISAGYRPIPLANYYPGNAYVDTIGVDVYDAGVPAGTSDRWRYLYDQRGGLGAVVAFARAHDKPLALPEWGLQPRSADGLGADPAFTRGILDVLSHDDVSFEAYFLERGPEQALLADPTSLQIYRDRILR